MKVKKWIITLVQLPGNVLLFPIQGLYNIMLRAVTAITSTRETHKKTH